jgi:hypothetical protein
LQRHAGTRGPNERQLGQKAGTTGGIDFVDWKRRDISAKLTPQAVARTPSLAGRDDTATDLVEEPVQRRAADAQRFCEFGRTDGGTPGQQGQQLGSGSFVSWAHALL